MEMPTWQCRGLSEYQRSRYEDRVKCQGLRLCGGPTAAPGALPACPASVAGMSDPTPSLPGSQWQYTILPDKEDTQFAEPVGVKSG